MSKSHFLSHAVTLSSMEFSAIVKFAEADFPAGPGAGETPSEMGDATRAGRNE
jgi:hypothetical protein